LTLIQSFIISEDLRDSRFYSLFLPQIEYPRREKRKNFEPLIALIGADPEF
jgi:hypothetical protein